MIRTYKDLLSSYEYTYDEKNELWRKNLGFGRNITVDVMFKNLFIIKINDKILHDGFVSSFKEFQDILQKVNI